MYYKQWLRVRRGLIVVSVTAAVLLAIHFLLLPVMGPHSGIVIGDDQAAKHAAAQVHENTDGPIPLSLFFAIAGVVAAIFAGIYGGSLSEENDGHLALAWTKPASRVRYALSVMSVDLLFVVAVFAIMLVFIAAIIAQHGQLHLLAVDDNAWFNLGRFLLVPAAWYGVCQALTASLRQHSGTVRGVFVVVAAIVLGLETASFPPAWHLLIKAVNYLNPIAYSSYSYPEHQPLQPFPTWELNLTALAAIAVLGISAALVQWRRLEA